MKHYSAIEFLNIGTGEDSTSGDFAMLVTDIVGYRGEIIYNTCRPDGSPQKLLDVSKIKKIGWVPKVPLHDGLALAYADFLPAGAATVMST